MTSAFTLPDGRRVEASYPIGKRARNLSARGKPILVQVFLIHPFPHDTRHRIGLIERKNANDWVLYDGPRTGNHNPRLKDACMELVQVHDALRKVSA